MTEEEKQLLLKDLCARLPYGIKVHFDNGSKNGRDFVLDELSDLYIYWIEYFKPYLRPISSMTEEEEIYYNTVYTTLKFYEKEDWLNAHYFDYRGLIPMGLALEAKEGMYKEK